MPTSTRVLVVDDARTMLMVVKKMLSLCGYDNTDTSGSGTEALRMIGLHEQEGRPYGLAIINYTMSPLSGLDLRRAMLANRGFAKVPAILITTAEVAARLSPDNRAVFSSILLKPFSLEALGGAVAKALGQSEASAPEKTISSGGPTRARRWSLDS